MRRQILPAILMLLAFTVLTGFAYPVVTWAVAQTAFRDKADGSLIQANGQVVGSSLIGQNFAKDEYFQPRPSAAGSNGYDATASSGSNLGPSNPKLIADCSPVPRKDDSGNPITDDQGNPINETNPDGSPVCDPNTVPQRVKAYRQTNGLSDDTPVPVDAVTASGSGLDPQISVANAKLQAPRVAKARGMTVAAVDALVDSHTDGRVLGFLGEPAVNVLELNLALDQTKGS
jgi:K+-transporting ATPase ATPase C chain